MSMWFLNVLGDSQGFFMFLWSVQSVLWFSILSFPFCHFSHWKVFNIHASSSNHFLFKISQLCGIFIIPGLGHLDGLFICVSWAADSVCAFSSRRRLSERWVQHCRVFYQMDTRHESGLSLKPGLQCVCWTAHCISGDHTGFHKHV